MSVSVKSKLSFSPSLPFVLLAVLFCVLFAAGGSSRADAPGQVVVQSASVLAIILAILKRPQQPFSSAKPVWLILSAAIVLGFVQLLPLPPAVWQALPGRTPLLEAAVVLGEPQPWRPISLVPGATVNAVSSLFVPLAVLLLITQLKGSERASLTGMILSLIAATMLVGLVQFSGLHLTTSVADNADGEVSGFLANRNHFALLMAIGSVIAPTWAVSRNRGQEWRSPVALGLIILFALSTLASGSRAGILIGALGLIAGITIARQGIKRSLARYPRWVFPAVMCTTLIIVAGFAVTSFVANRAISINRLLAMDPSQDLRRRALPHIVEMIRIYFPAGSGLGSFDPIYRMHEPLDLLADTYLNHAHNDIIEVILDGGLIGALILFGAMLWWSKQTLRLFNTVAEMRNALPKAGSAIILLVVAASSVDYPARTPIVMAILVAAAAWLAGIDETRGASLPQSSRLL
jgi:O-antigen ligase